MEDWETAKKEWLEQKKKWKNLNGIGMCHAKVEINGEVTESCNYAIFRCVYRVVKNSINYQEK